MSEQCTVGILSKEHSQNACTYTEEVVDREAKQGKGDSSSINRSKLCHVRDSSLTNRDMNAKNIKNSGKHSIDHWHHHSSHHSSNHHYRLWSQGAPSDDCEQFLSDEDYHINIERFKDRPEFGESAADIPVSNDLSRFLRRISNIRQENQLHEYPNHQQSRQYLVSPGREELSEHHENHLSHGGYLNSPIQITKEKHDQLQLPVNGKTEDDEAEDGEILEDGELTSDDMIVEKDRNSFWKDSTEGISVSPPKLTSKGEKQNKKKSVHKDMKRKEYNDKIKHRKLTDVDKLENKGNPTPAWGSGYQGPKPNMSHFNNKQSQCSRGSKGCHSPPGLYDSPSYSDESDEEAELKTFMTEGYTDASVAADENEGIFHSKLSLDKKKRPDMERNDRKRNLEGNPEGPIKKKPTVDLAMSDRPVCKFYMEGKCAKGSGCQFSHDAEKPRKIEVCKYHLTVKGCIKQKCLYMHDFPCKYYHTGTKCYSGDKCKFSHDPLTEETRKALEMRVAAEDIIKMENPVCECEHRELHSMTDRPSLLGSPPRFQQEAKKIPSLFEIEVHPPSQSPKPPLQVTNRSSGFYSETTISPKPSTGSNSNGSVSIGIINSSAPMNQQSLLKQGNMGGPGLLQTPLRPVNILVNSMCSSRPPVMMSIQQGMNLQQQRPGGSIPIHFLGPRPINCSQQGGNVPPVLNILGAIIREAAMQKGPGISSSGNMNIGPTSGTGPISILQNMKNLRPSIHVVSPNNMQQGMVVPSNLIQNNIGSMTFQMQSSSMNNMPPLKNIIGLNNIMRNMGPTNFIGNIGPSNNIGPCDNTGPSSAIGSMMESNKNIETGQEVDAMDVDYRIKPDFGGMDEVKKDLSELDKIRQQIQAQIDKEDEEGEGEIDDTVKNIEACSKIHKKSELLNPVKADSLQEKKDLRDAKAIMKTDLATETGHLEIPVNLPKKQRELFKRIQQQQLLREREKKRREALKTVEEGEDKGDDSEEEDGGQKTKSVLKMFNQKPSSAPSRHSSTDSGSLSINSSGSFNIIQMINAIKSHSTSNPLIKDKDLLSMSSKFSSSQNSQKPKQNIFLSPTLTPSVSTSLENVSNAHHSTSSSFHLTEHTVDLPAISALPIKPLVYSVVKIFLNVPKPYTQLPNNVNASDPAFKDDPRVKWHLHYLEKQVQNMVQRDNSDGKRPQNQRDPRLKKQPSDPRLTKTLDSLNRGAGRASDPRLQKVQSQSQPTDPRPPRQIGGNLDPQLNRQNSQNNPDIFLSASISNKVEVPMNSMSGVMNNQKHGVLNNDGSLMNQMVSPMNQMSGSVNSNPACSHIHNVGSVNNTGLPMNNTLGPVHNQFSGSVRPLQGSGLVGNNMDSSVNNLGKLMSSVGDPFNQRGPGKVHINRMDWPGNNLQNCKAIEGHIGNILRAPLSLQTQNGNNLKVLNPKMKNSSEPILGSQKTSNDPCNSSDPRLKNRHLNTQQQGMYTKEDISGIRNPHSMSLSLPNGDRLNDSRTFNGGNTCRSCLSSLGEHDDSHDIPDYSQGNVYTFSSPRQFKMSQAKEEWAKKSDCKIENSDRVQLLPTSRIIAPLQYSDASNKSAHRFDHRNDPRFKRTKRLVGQPKSNIEYSSTVDSGNDQRDICTGEGTEYNNYSPSRLSGGQPCKRSAPSPSLPDTLYDFDLPHSTAEIAEGPEVDLKVKDLFRTIDPTASPFC